MPPTVEQQLDLPVIEIIGSDTVEFPRLDMDDLMRWSAEIKAARYRKATARLAADRTMAPADKDRRLQELEDEGINIGWLLGKAYEAEGIRRVLVLSLKKAGRGDEAILSLLKRIHFSRQRVIAAEVLSPPAPPAKDETNPPTGGQGSDFTSPATGDSSAPSSLEPPDET